MREVVGSSPTRLSCSRPSGQGTFTGHSPAHAASRWLMSRSISLPSSIPSWRQRGSGFMAVNELGHVAIGCELEDNGPAQARRMRLYM